MTDNLPAVRTDLAPVTATDTDSWIGIASDVVKLANLIAPTEFVPRALRDSAPATAAAILYGREVGLPPMTALTQTHVIEGKPAMSAEAMRALVLAQGHDLEVVESNRARCELRGRRRGSERWTPVAVSIDEFAHLRSKDNWRNYPRQMLQARATAELCRLVFPDVIHGFRAVEEFDDLDESAAAGALEAPAPSSTVRRTGRKAAARKTAPAPLEPAAARPEPNPGPPLPGEPGYSDDGTQTSAGGRAAPDTGPVDPPGPGEPPAEAPPSPGGVAPGSVPLPVEPTSPPPGEAQTTDVPRGGKDAGGVDSEAAPAAVDQETPAGEGEGEAPKPAGESEPPGGAKDRGPRMSTRAQHRMIFGLLGSLGVESRQDRLDVARAICHRPVGSFNDLTHDNASHMIETLGRLSTREDLDGLLLELSRAEADRWNGGDRS